MKLYVAIVSLLLLVSLTVAAEIKRVIIEYTDGTTVETFPATNPAPPQTQPIPPTTLPATLPTVGRIDSLSVIDHATNKSLATSNDNGMVAVTLASGQRIYLYAAVSGEVDRVDFDFGSGVRWSEKSPPYTYGLQFSPPGWNPKAGRYPVTVIPYSANVAGIANLYVVTITGERVADYVPTKVGFTDLPLAPGAKDIFAANNGNDTSGDGSQAKPFRTLQRAVKAVRNATGDRVRPMADSTFYGTVNWTASGKAGFPSGIIAFGSGNRPRIETNGSGISVNGSRVANVAFVGLDLYAANRDPSAVSGFNPKALGSYGIDLMLPAASNILAEDNRIAYFAYGISAHPGANDPPHKNVTIRRNIIVNNWGEDNWGKTDYNGQGFYGEKIDGLTIEENYFDLNGYVEAPNLVVKPTQYRHDQYINENCTNVNVRNNWIFRSANFGVQARGGGKLDTNLFWDNCNHAMTCGAKGEFLNNMIFGGHVITSGPNAFYGYTGIIGASTDNAFVGNWFVGESDVSKIPNAKGTGWALNTTRREWTPEGPVRVSKCEQNVFLSWPNGAYYANFDNAKPIDERLNPFPRLIPDVKALWPNEQRLAILRNRPLGNWVTDWTPGKVLATLNESR